MDVLYSEIRNLLAIRRQLLDPVLGIHQKDALLEMLLDSTQRLLLAHNKWAQQKFGGENLNI
jgi:hypothetical protein